MAFMSSRRSALKTLGLGISALALGHRSLLAQPAPAPSPTPSGPYTLPQLPYPYEALEPHIDAETMRLHHTRHHQAQITAANRALAELPDLAALSVDALLTRLPALDLPAAVKTTLRNNAGGHHNHSLFWRTLAPATSGGGKPPEDALAEALQRDLGGFEETRKRLTEASLRVFGSGWGWLSRKADGTLTVHATANQDSPLMEGLTPLLGIDVWEHAYYLRYQNRRADYLGAFWNIVDWKAVGAELANANAGA
jgi:Fe-Mn family superoxide dismutase